MRNPIKPVLALVGVGRWGTKYLQTIGQMDSVRVKYVCSRHIFSKKFKRKYIKVSDYKKLASFPDINGIIVATPPETHFKISSFFLTKGYPLLIEKPVVVTTQELKKLSGIGKVETNVFGGYIDTFNPAFIAFNKSLKNIGELKSLFFENGKYEKSPSKISALWDWGSHSVSNCLTIMKLMPVSVSAYTLSDTNNTLTIDLRFKNDVQANILIGRKSPKKIRRALAIGKKGTLVFDDTLEQKITLFSFVKNRYSHPTFNDSSPLENEISSFAALINGKNVSTGISHISKVTKILLLAEKSSQLSGKILKVS